MALMRETVGSIRVFFAVVGMIILGSLYLVWGALDSLSSVLDMGISIVWGLGYLYFAVMLHSYLSLEKVKIVKFFLLLPLTEHFVISMWHFLTNAASPDVLSLGVNILITWYLYSSVSRLSHENVINNES